MPYPGTRNDLDEALYAQNRKVGRGDIGVPRSCALLRMSGMVFAWHKCLAA